MKNFIALAIVATFIGCASHYETVSNAIVAHKYSGPYAIDVSGAGDAIMLDGRVSSEGDRRKMEQIARAVKGVHRVENNLVIEPRAPKVTVTMVPPPRPSDAEIRASIQKIVDDFDDTDSSLSWRIEGSTVAVSGQASSFRHVDALLSEILMVPGINDVRSDISVNGHGYMSEWKGYR